MKRRKAIKGMVLFALGSQIVYSCKDKYQAIKSLPLNNLPLSDKDLALIDQLSTNILPLQNIEALKDHTTTPFILTMANDCLSPEDRSKFIKGYQEFDNYVKGKLNKELAALTIEEFQSLMETIQKEIDRENPMPVHFFSSYVRDKNIQYLTSSEYFLTTYRAYEMAPGFYNGCVPLS
jgi:hypothetical protein